MGFNQSFLYEGTEFLLPSYWQIKMENFFPSISIKTFKEISFDHQPTQ